MTDNNYDHDAFLAQAQEGMNYIDQFKDTASGIIALSGGFSLEAAAKAGLLKESSTLTGA